MKRIKFVFTIIFISLAVFITTVGGIYYLDNYSTTDYYSMVVSDGDKVDDTSVLSYSATSHYTYQLGALNEKGEKIIIEFNTLSDKPLRKGALLKLRYNHKRGVIGWEEIDYEQLPLSLKEIF